MTNAGGKLQISARSAQIEQLSIEGAEHALGIEEGQTSHRAGDRLFFTTTTANGTELWKLENGALTEFDVATGGASSNPQSLVDINGVLFFTADTAGKREVWRVVDGTTLQKPTGQTFNSPADLINAGGTLVFTAQVGTGGDREVYSYDTTNGFLQLSNVPGSASGAGELAFLNGKVMFAAQDSTATQNFSTTTAFLGRELWQATLGDDFSATLVKNIGLPDTLGVNFFFFTIPGTITSSSPQDLTASSGNVFFSADDGSSGRELWISDGTPAHTLRVKDIVAGAGSSAPTEFTTINTSAGARLFFVADGKLWITDGTESGTSSLNLGGATPSLLTAAGDRLFFRANGRLWVTNGETTQQFDQIIPPKIPLEVRVLAGEGDNRVTGADLNAATVLTRSVLIGSEKVEVDITEAVKQALARGDTRLTVRVENPAGDKAVTFNLAGALKSGGTGLQVTAKQPGLLADLLSGDGTVIALGKPTIDLRATEAGTYYVRVYSPTGPVTQDTPFEIAVDAPIQGYTHPISDRDRISGGDGDDLIIGNQGLDRLRGDSGRDDFVAELIEVRDFDQPAGETLSAVDPGERSTIPPEGPPGRCRDLDRGRRLTRGDRQGARHSDHRFVSPGCDRHADSADPHRRRFPAHRQGAVLHRQLPRAHFGERSRRAHDARCIGPGRAQPERAAVRNQFVYARSGIESDRQR